MKHLRFWIGIAIGAFFVWLLFRRLDFHELLQALQGTRYLLLVPSLLLVLVSFVVRAYRWGYFFLGESHIRYRKLYTSTMIGYLGNMMLPARAGEFVRAYVISKLQGGLTASKAFATIMAERIFDGFTLVVLLCFSLLVLPSGKSASMGGGEASATVSRGHLFGMAWVALGVLGVATALLVLIYARGERVSRVVGRTVSLFSEHAAQHATRSLALFARGLDIVGDRKRLVHVSVLSFFVWLPAVLAVYPVLLAFPVDFHWPWYTSLVVQAVVCVGITIPASPGFVGTFHAFCVAGLLLCGPVKYETAVAFAVVYHGASMIALFFMGVVCLWVEKVSFVEVAREVESSDAER